MSAIHSSGCTNRVRRARQPRTIFAGQLTSPLVVRPTGTIAVVGVRFRADGVPAVIRGPQHRLAGLTLDLGDLSATLARQLRDACEAPPAVSRAVRAVDDCLLRHLDDSRIDPCVRGGIGSIQRGRGAVSVARWRRGRACRAATWNDAFRKWWGYRRSGLPGSRAFSTHFGSSSRAPQDIVASPPPPRAAMRISRTSSVNSASLPAAHPKRTC